MYRLFPVSDKFPVPSVHCNLTPISRERYENTLLNLSINTVLPVGYPLVTHGYPSYEGSNLLPLLHFTTPYYNFRKTLRNGIKVRGWGLRCYIPFVTPIKNI